MNSGLLSKCNLAKWHEAGYTGKGVRVAVFDDRPFLTEDMKAYASIPQADYPAEAETHSTKVAKCLHEAAPEAEIFCLSARTTDADKNVDWIIANDIDIISSSYIPPASLEFFKRYKKIEESGIVICVAAGNDNKDKMHELLTVDWTIAVGAAEVNGEGKTSYSNYGEQLDCLAYIPNLQNGKYSYRPSGTSFAQPFAAGMLACYMQYAKEQGLPYDREAIKQFIAENCRDIYTEGRDLESGYGVLHMPQEIPQKEEVKDMVYQYPFKKDFIFGTPYGTKGGIWKVGWHSGLDLKSANYGGDGRVYPIAEGVVDAVAFSKSYGNYVMIRHDDGYISLYAHLHSIVVGKGQRVALNTVIGVEGTTGNSTGVHLHLEIHKGEYSYPASIDPQAFIEERLYKESEEEHMLTKTKLLLNGVEKEVQTIQHEGYNYIKLRDLVDDRIAVDYDAAKKLPILEVRDK